MKDGSEDHAIVLGGSIAGLLAARVLADAYDQVTVVDRDELRSGRQAATGRAARPAHPRAARPRPAGTGPALPRAHRRAGGARRTDRGHSG